MTTMNNFPSKWFDLTLWGSTESRCDEGYGGIVGDDLVVNRPDVEQTPQKAER